MALSNDLVSEFVKVTNDTPVPKQESTAYGTIVKQGDTTYVKLDGSELLTPVTTTIVVKDGDRVIVTIKNHVATITGDLTNPSASDKDVQEIGGKITEFEIVLADKVSTKQLEAEVARISKLETEYAEIDKIVSDNITATDAKFETIDVKVAEIDTIKTNVVEIDGKVSAHEAEFVTIRSDIAEFENLTTEKIESVEGNFHTLESDYADFKVTTTNEITANRGAIDELETKKIDTTTANAKYANIDFSNIGAAAIEKLFTDSGIIKDLIMNDGKVTGELVGVTIKGDLIEGNTIKADKLVILGTDGLYYKLNLDAIGEASFDTTDETYQNGLDGTAIIAQSVTAEKVAVTDLVAFGATIGGFHITNHSLYSGIKESATSEVRGAFFGDDGEFSIGDANNYLRYYKDENGAYRLEMMFGGSTLDDSMSDLEGRVNNTIDEAVGNAIDTLDGELQTLSGTVNELSETVDSKVTAEEVNDAIQTEMSKGVDKISTSAGYKFDNDGLNITRAGSEMSTVIDDDGMIINKTSADGSKTERLIANSEGVIAYNLQAKTFLVVGDNSRFEKYTKDNQMLFTGTWEATSDSTGEYEWGKIQYKVPVEYGETYILTGYINDVRLRGRDYDGFVYGYAYNSEGTMIYHDYIFGERTIDDPAIAYILLSIGVVNYNAGDVYKTTFEKKGKVQTGCFWIGDMEV